MTTPHCLYGDLQPTRGCRFCFGRGVGYHSLPCLHCPAEAKRIADEEYEREQARKARVFTVPEALEYARFVAGMARQMWMGFGPKPPTAETIFESLVAEGRVSLPEPLYTVQAGDQEGMAVLVEVFHAERLREAHELAGGSSRGMLGIVAERLAAAQERRRAQRATDVSPEVEMGGEPPTKEC